MKIVIIDAQGGGIGKQLVAAIKKRDENADILAVGTNTAATVSMLKAGAGNAATGENAVKVACRKADVIVGPVGIVIADSLYGEISEEIALAVAKSNARRVLIPFNNCDNIVVGSNEKPVSELINLAVDEIFNGC